MGFEYFTVHKVLKNPQNFQDAKLCQKIRWMPKSFFGCQKFLQDAKKRLFGILGCHMATLSPSHLAVLGQARSHPEWLRGLKWRPPSARSIAVSNEPVFRRSERDPRDGLSISGVRARDSQASWRGVLL